MSEAGTKSPPCAPPKPKHRPRRRRFPGWIVGTLLLFVSCSPVAPRSPEPGSGPPLTQGRVVRVADLEALYRAVDRLRSGTTVLLAKGDYQLTRSLIIPPGVDNVALRGATGNYHDVILRGPGMASRAVPHGIAVNSTDGLLIADLTIGWVGNHALMIQPGCRNIHVYHCRLVDTGQQFVKGGSGRRGDGADGGRVEYSLLEYSQWGPADGYTNGVDIHGGKDWLIRHNLFRNIRTPVGARFKGVPAILMWNGAGGTVCEGNTFVNCDRAIALGLVERSEYPDHAGGLIRNNFIFADPGAVPHVDAGIFVASPGAKVLHNTVLLNGGYDRAIEARFPFATGVEVRNNLCDAEIAARDGAEVMRSGNVIESRRERYRDAAKGDLHLVTTQGLPAVAVHPDCVDDWDGQRRREGLTTVGADEPSAASVWKRHGGLPLLPRNN